MEVTVTFRTNKSFEMENKESNISGMHICVQIVKLKSTHSSCTYSRHTSLLCRRKRNTYLRSQRRTKVILPSAFFLFLALLSLPFLICFIPVKTPQLIPNKIQDNYTVSARR